MSRGIKLVDMTILLIHTSQFRYIIEHTILLPIGCDTTSSYPNGLSFLFIQQAKCVDINVCKDLELNKA